MIKNKIKNIECRTWCQKETISTSDSSDTDWLWPWASYLAFLNLLLICKHSYLTELWALNECSNVAQNECSNNGS